MPSKIGYRDHRSKESGVSEKQHLVLTVHGIRTFGSWQERLETLVAEHDPTIRFQHYKIGYFWLLSYAIPLLRWVEVRRFQAQLRGLASFRGRIDIFAHSFGTYLVAKAMLDIPIDQCPQVDNLVFAGSVLPESFPWKSLLSRGRIVRVINECGEYDWPLCFNRILLPGVGATGFVGITRATGDTFGDSQVELRNYWHQLGHSGFFTAQFLQQFWVPLVVSNEHVRRTDMPPNTRVGRILMPLLQGWGPFKAALHVCLLLFIWHFGYQIPRSNALSTRLNTARQLTSLGEGVMSSDPTLSLWLGLYAGRNALTPDELLPETQDLIYRAITSGLPIVLHTNLGQTNDAQWSPDGSLIASLHSDRLIVWDSRTGDQLRTIFLLEKPLSFAWSPKSDRIVTANPDVGATIWNVSTGQAVQRVGRVVLSASWSHDNSIIFLVGPDFSINAWNSATGEVRNSLKCPLGTSLFSTSSTGIEESNGILCGASAGYSLFLRDKAGAFNKVITGPIAGQVRLFPSPDGRFLGILGKDGSVTVVNTSDKTVESHSMIGTPLRILAGFTWSPNSKELVFGSAGDRSLRVLDLANRDSIQTRVGNQSTPMSTSWSPDGTKLASGGADGDIVVWQGNDPQPMKRFMTGTYPMILNWSSNQKELLTVSAITGQVSIWNGLADPAALKTGGLVSRPQWDESGTRVFAINEDHQGLVFSLSRDGKLLHSDSILQTATFATWNEKWTLLLTTDEQGKAIIWSVSGNVLRFLRSLDACPTIAGSWSRDGSKIALQCKSGQVLIVDGEQGKAISSMSGQIRIHSSLSWAPKGRYLALGGVEGVEVWDVIMSRWASHITEHTHVASDLAWNPEGTKLATASLEESAVWIWDPKTGHPLQVLASEDGAVSGVAFSPDGLRIAAGSLHATSVWDLDSGRLLYRIAGPVSFQNRVAWRPDGKWLAIGRSHDALHLWPTGASELLEFARSLAPRKMRKDECEQYLSLKTCPPD